jgi:hypothetical protein
MDHRHHIVSAVTTRRDDAADALLEAGLIVFAAYHLGLAVWMSVSPHSFYRALGPFGAFNGHYLRDVATFEAALGVGFLVAIRRPSWRVPVLAVTAAQFALHTVNHLADADAAHPRWTGWFDFASLLASTLLLVWMLRTAARRQPDRDAKPAGEPAVAERAARSSNSHGQPAVSPASPQSPRAERRTT